MIEYIKIYDWLKRKKFKRYDVIIKYNFIKGYYKTDEPEDFDYEPYNIIIRDRGREPYPKRFIALIKSFKKKGYDEAFPLQMASNGAVSGFSHRLACCLYFRISNIPVIFNEHLKNKQRNYDLKEMESLGFSGEKLFKTYKKIVKRLKRYG